MLTHLQRLEAESIHILREAVAESERPVMLYSIGKDSSVLLHLALKAFYPAKPPFPLLHVDTTWKFRAMYEMRDTVAQRCGVDLIVYQNPECLERGINPFTHGSALHTDQWKTEGLRQALDQYGFDLAFGGAADGPFRLPVQLVTRPDLDFRGYAGIIAGGTVRPGDEVRVLPSGATATVQRIVTYDGDLPTAEAGQSVTLTLDREIDVSRGDLIVAAADPAGLADQFEAHLVWMHPEPLLPGRPYLMKLGSSTATCSVTHIKHGINVNTLERTPAATLAVNDIAVANIATDRRLPFDPYQANRETGGFVLIDRLTSVTVGAGLIDFALRRSDNIHWQALDVTKEARVALKGHRPGVVWFTGISGAGKSTIANALEQRLHVLGGHTATLDGDNVRHGLNRDLGFTDADRVENIRRVGEVARLMADAGLLVLVSCISPFRAERDAARALVEPGEFTEVFVDTPLDVAEGRDRKGLYRKARAGRLPHFTGIDSAYEPPPSPEVRIDTTASTVQESVEQIVTQLRAQGILP